MDIIEDMKINMHQPVVGYEGTELGEIFDMYIKQYGYHNIHFICSFVYNLGKIHGKRAERAKRKK